MRALAFVVVVALAGTASAGRSHFGWLGASSPIGSR